MDLEKPAPIPPAFDFTKFLVSSITFMRHLREIYVYFDDKQLVRVTKGVGAPKRLTTPPNPEPVDKRRFMNIKGLRSACGWFIYPQVVSR